MVLIDEKVNVDGFGWSIHNTGYEKSLYRRT
jgi:hypothetical protein